MPSLHRRAVLAGFCALAPLGRVMAMDSPLVVKRHDDGSIILEGPLDRLRSPRGELLSIPIQNMLDAPISLAIRGLRSEAVPLTVAPRASETVKVTPRDAGTFLLQPLQTGEGPAQLRAGLSAMVVIDRPETPRADGEKLIHLTENQSGIRLNGQETLSLAARANARLWLRLANGTAQRIMALTFADLPVTLMALDGQPCEPFRLEGGRLTLAPGQRAELFCDVPARPGANLPISLDNLAGGKGEGALTISDEPPLRTEPLPAPSPLPDNGLPQTMDFRRATRAEITLDSATFARPLVTAKSGSVVMLGFKNDTQRFQAVHWAGHPARLLDGLDDGWKPFFLDTVLVAPGATERIAFIADRPGQYPIFSQVINDLSPPLAGRFMVT